MAEAVDWHVGSATPQEIDATNILNASIAAASILAKTFRILDGQ